jgi:hypothetical protein
MLVYENTLISMTPQSNFTIIAPIVPERMPVLKDLLNQMNVRPGTNTCLGMADPHNDVIPFGQFAKLHTARFVILDDQTLGDFERVGEQVPNYGPLKLAFMGDCDGCADDVLADMAQRANKGLRDVFSNCECFDVRTDLLTWINKHRQRAAAAYVNHIGRTVCQIRHEHALRTELVGFLKEHSAPDADPQTTRNMLIKHARAKNFIPAAAEEPTPLAWRVRNFFHLITLPAILAIFIFALWIALRSAAGVAYPVALVGVAWGLLAVVLAVVLIFFLALRWYETTEPEIDVRPTDQYTEMLAQDEDHDLVNQFSIVGSVRPTAFRRRMLIVNLWVIDWFARHIYGRGYLARIRSIHFARWVFMDDKNRVLFASTYDGSLESYNDDFINKRGFGLNFAFGGAVGYPRCRWVILEGAKREQKFKYILRRHQLPTQVRYNAYPGLTVYDLARNTRVCEGIERPRMSNKDIRRWLTDL